MGVSVTDDRSSWALWVVDGDDAAWVITRPVVLSTVAILGRDRGCLAFRVSRVLYVKN